MTKYFSIVVVLPLLADAAFDAMKLDLAINTESCAKKYAAGSKFGNEGACECKTNFEPSKVCTMPIHSERHVRNYGRNGIEAPINSPSLKLTFKGGEGKTRKQCGEMVGQAEGAKMKPGWTTGAAKKDMNWVEATDKCNIMYAAYLCDTQEACDDGECYVFCGFYPEITDGITLQMLYPSTKGSTQGAWGFVAAGLKCDDSTPVAAQQSKRTSPYHTCDFHSFTGGQGGSQNRNSVKWGAGQSECCSEVCKYYCNNKKLMVKDDRVGGRTKLGSGDECCGDPCPSSGCPVQKKMEAVWKVWKRHAKCARSVDILEDPGNAVVKSDQSRCQKQADAAGHGFMIVDFGSQKNKFAGKGIKGDCYSVNDCLGFETGVSEDFVIYTTRNFSEIATPLLGEGENCSALNHPPDCAAGLICDNSKTAILSSPDAIPSAYWTKSKQRKSGESGQGVCTSASKNVSGNNCVALKTNSQYDRTQCSPNHACSALLQTKGGLGVCQSCDANPGQGVGGYSNGYGDGLWNKWATEGCMALAHGHNAWGAGETNSRNRCVHLSGMCPNVGKCFRPGGMSKCVPPSVKNCLFTNHHGDCWACPKGYTSKWSNYDNFLCNHQGSRVQATRVFTGYINDTRWSKGHRAYAYNWSTRCHQCEIKCESGFSYALNDTEVSYAQLPDDVAYDCPAGYKQITPMMANGKPASAKSGCCEKMSAAELAALVTTTAIPGTTKVSVQSQVSTFADLDFAKMTDALKLGMVEAVCNATIAKNKGATCTGMCSKGSVKVTTTVAGVQGKLKNAAVADVLAEVKKVSGIANALVSGKTLLNFAPPTISDAVTVTTPATTATTTKAAASKTPTQLDSTTSSAFRALPLSIAGIAAFRALPLSIAGIAVLIWQ